MSQREGDPKFPKKPEKKPVKPPEKPAKPPIPATFEPSESEPTNLIPSSAIPSGRSLGEDPTSLAAGTLSGLIIDSSDTALVMNPEPSGADNSETAIVIAPEPSDNSATALLVFPSTSAEISHTDDMPAQQSKALSESERRAARKDFSLTGDMSSRQRQALSEAERRAAKGDLSLTGDMSSRQRQALSEAERRAAKPDYSLTTDMPKEQQRALADSERPLEGPKTLPLGTPLSSLYPDATQVRKAPGDEATAMMKASGVPGRNEPSLGAKVTQAVGATSGEATEMRQVFAPFDKDDGRGRRRRGENSRQGEGANSALSSSKLWIAVLSAVILALGGFLLNVFYSARQREETLTGRLRSAVEKAHQRGRLLDFIEAESQLRALLGEQPSDGVALSARALMLAESLYEFGGGSEWVVEAQSAARQSQGENRPSAVAAQLFVSLSRAELKPAESELLRLNALPAGADTSAELAPLPLGLRDYLTSQVLLVGGRDHEAIEALRKAVSKNPLPLWQRRLGYLLHRVGRDAEALPHLIDVEQRQPDLCGGQIDLAFLRGRAGAGSALRPALATLRGLIEPPRIGADPCGRGDHARAALGTAELLLWNEPTSRAEARTLLDKAETLASPNDVVFADALARVRLRTFDFEKAEQLTRAALEKVSTRRSTRLLLTQALLRRGQGSEALSVLEPLTAQAEAGKLAPASTDLEALVLRAQGLLRLNDTLEAQKLGRRILASNGIPGAVRTDAQLLLAQVYLRLQEPAAARRALEPVMQKVTASASGNPDTSGTTADQLLDAQLLWAQTLLAVRPPEQQEARALLEAVVGRAPERVEARTMLGKLLREMTEWGQAEQQLTAAMRTDERYTPARRELAALLMQRGDVAKAHALYRELVKEEQDADLLLASARAQRLDGAGEQALATLANVKRGRGEVVGKYDEALLVEKARALLALDRPGEAEALLRGPAQDMSALRRPTLPALLIRSMVSGVVGPARAPALAQGRALLGRIAGTWRSDSDVRLAEIELLIAEDNAAAARLGLEALITSLRTVPPSSVGEEGPLRQRAEKLLAGLPSAQKGRR